MNRLALAAATATVPPYAAEIPVLIHQRLKDGATRNKATLTFAEKRVLVLGIGRRHASRKNLEPGISPQRPCLGHGTRRGSGWHKPLEDISALYPGAPSLAQQAAFEVGPVPCAHL